MRKSIITVILTTVFIVGIFITPENASAIEQGSWKLNPWFKTEEQWDSNIFYDRDDPKSDWITILTPGIYGEWGFGQADKHKAMASYQCDIGIFGKYKDQQYANSDAFGALALDFNKVSVDLNNRFQFTSDRAGTEFEHRTLRKIDEANAVVGWHYNKMDFDTGYKYYIVDYVSDSLDSLDYYMNEVFLTGYFEMAPKTKFLVEFQYQNFQYWDTGERNANAFAPLIGVKGQIAPKLEGLVKVGYKVKDYNSSERNDYSNFVAHIDLFYDMSERVDMTFGYHREPYESTYTNNNYYAGDHFTYNLTYDLGKNFTGIFDAFYYYNAYPSPGPGEDTKRRDHEWEAKPRLEYKWKEWAVIGGGYTFHQRTSNVGSVKYGQHVVSADVKLMF